MPKKSNVFINESDQRIFFSLNILIFKQIFNTYIMYALKILLNQYLRLIITSFGVAPCLILMLFLLSIYHGVMKPAVHYIVIR